MPRPDVLTYRYNGALSYVPPAKSFEEGVQLARAEFDEIRNVESANISICVNGVVAGHRQLIRIGPAAWDAVMNSLARYEVLDILVKTPRIVVNAPDTFLDALPKYEDVKAKSGSDNFLAPSRGPSPCVKHIPLPETQVAKKDTRSQGPSKKNKSDWARNMSLFCRRDY